MICRLSHSIASCNMPVLTHSVLLENQRMWVSSVSMSAAISTPHFHTTKVVEEKQHARMQIRRQVAVVHSHWQSNSICIFAETDIARLASALSCWSDQTKTGTCVKQQAQVMRIVHFASMPSGKCRGITSSTCAVHVANSQAIVGSNGSTGWNYIPPQLDYMQQMGTKQKQLLLTAKQDKVWERNAWQGYR